ncbi:MAG: hypothetical protein JWN51_1882 [Phycisphaerales bacterium]|nr:hypothetical protein [Phycisphaerales bacterium]
MNFGPTRIECKLQRSKLRTEVDALLLFTLYSSFFLNPVPDSFHRGGGLDGHEHVLKRLVTFRIGRAKGDLVSAGGEVLDRE